LEKKRIEDVVGPQREFFSLKQADAARGSEPPIEECMSLAGVSNFPERGAQKKALDAAVSSRRVRPRHGGARGRHTIRLVGLVGDTAPRCDNGQAGGFIVQRGPRSRCRPILQQPVFLPDDGAPSGALYGPLTWHVTKRMLL